MTANVGPIRPEDALPAKRESIPEVVFEAFNELIIRDLTASGHSIVRQGEVVALIESKGLPRAKLFMNNWLDVEPYYREVGWEVVYDKPAYNESYEATFSFRKGKA